MVSVSLPLYFIVRLAIIANLNVFCWFLLLLLYTGFLSR